VEIFQVGKGLQKCVVFTPCELRSNQCALSLNIAVAASNFCFSVCCLNKRDFTIKDRMKLRKVSSLVTSMTDQNNLFDFAKVQMLMNGGGGNAMGTGNMMAGAAGGSGWSGMFMNNTVMGLFIMTFCQFLFKFVEQVVKAVHTAASAWFNLKMEAAKQKLNESALVAEPANRTFIHKFVRSYKQEGQHTPNCELCDAILSHVVNHNENFSTLITASNKVVNHEKAINITSSISFTLQKLIHEAKGGLEGIEFQLCSTKSAQDLLLFQEQLLEAYTSQKNDKLGLKLYFFDQWLPKGDTEKFAEQNKIKVPIRFKKNQFSTTRSFDNIFFEQKDTVQQRLARFNDFEWYKKCGIPHTLGFLFHGVPGCGKTSTIKALANDSQRHIFNLVINKHVGKEDLKALFYTPFVQIVDNEFSNQTQTFYIPTHKRLYVIEETDLVSDGVLGKRETTVPIPPPAPSLESRSVEQATDPFAERLREYEQPQAAPAPVYDVGHFLSSASADTGFGMQYGPSATEQKEKKTTTNSDDVDLATMLTILDGTLETPGRILVMTTNHPEFFDDALIRPGRIDLIVEYRRCNKAVIADMFAMFFDNLRVDERLLDQRLSQVPEYIWSPAEITQVFMNHLDDWQQALQALTEPKKHLIVVNDTF
jgi:hypothetical protein